MKVIIKPIVIDTFETFSRGIEKKRGEMKIRRRIQTTALTIN